MTFFRTHSESGSPATRISTICAPPRPSSHVAAGPTRLVYEVPEGTRITYTLEKVLEIQAAASQRIADGDEPGMLSKVAILHFKSPAEGEKEKAEKDGAAPAE